MTLNTDELQAEKGMAKFDEADARILAALDDVERALRRARVAVSARLGPPRG